MLIEADKLPPVSLDQLKCGRACEFLFAASLCTFEREERRQKAKRDRERRGRS